jgi:hypothetical protein
MLQLEQKTKKRTHPEVLLATPYIFNMGSRFMAPLQKPNKQQIQSACKSSHPFADELDCKVPLLDIPVVKDPKQMTSQAIFLS